MENKNTILSILTVLVLALFIAACEDTGGGGGTAAFIGGTESISVYFEESAPPAEVFDNKQYPFQITIKLENKGEYDVSKDKIKVNLVGIDAPEFGRTINDMIQEPLEDLMATKLDATTGNIISGTQTYVEFGDFEYQEKIIATQEKTLQVKLCYDYGTVAQAKLCIKENPLAPEKNPICDVRGQKQVAVSSGPIQITSLEQTPSASDKIRFSFNVEHKGDGSVFKKTTECKEKGDENKVFITVDTGDMTSDLVCTGIKGGSTSGYVTLFDDKRMVTCTQSIGEKKGNFEKIVTIGLEYGYKKIKETMIVVKPSS